MDAFLHLIELKFFAIKWAHKERAQEREFQSRNEQEGGFLL